MTPVAAGNAAGTGDRIAQRCRPQVLDEGDRGSAAVRDGGRDVPDLVLIDQVPVRARLETGQGAGRHAVLAVEAETDERSHRGSQAFGLVDRQVAPLHRSQVPGLVLLDDQGVDEPDDIALAESAELRDDLTGEVWLVEAHDEQLNGSDGHG